MLKYYYVKDRDKLYVYDDETGFYKSFNKPCQEWYTPVISFSEIEHDYDIDLVEIPEATAKELSNGVSFDKQLKTYLSWIGKL